MGDPSRPGQAEHDQVHRWSPVAPTPDLVRPVPVDPSGERGPTLGRAAGPRWRTSTPGHHVPAHVGDDLPEQRILEQSMRLPADGVVTGWAGCRLWGANLLDGLGPDGRTRLPVPLAVGTRGGLRRHPAVTVSFERLPPWESGRRHGIPTARPERCVFDAIRAVDEREGLVALEAALAGRITSLERIGTYAATHRSARRFAQVAWALERASSHSLSPNETRLRTACEEDADRPRLLVNPTVWSLDGRRLGMVDLLDEEAGEVLEFDGADHRSKARHVADIGKEDRLRRAGLEVVRVTGTELLHRDRLAERLVASRARAPHTPPAQRRWRATPCQLDPETWLREQEDWALWHENLPDPETSLPNGRQVPVG